MNGPPHLAFRLTTLLFAVLLGTQSIWLLLAEISRPHIGRLPTDAVAAAAAGTQRSAATAAAKIGAIRGELWADSAFTYADLLFGKMTPNPNADFTQTLANARADLTHALRLAPHQSSAWLLLAGLALNYPSESFNATEILKMSYYTGPSDQDLLPLRLSMAIRSEAFNDVEVRPFVTRDLRAALLRKQTSVLAEAYNVASPPGKRLIEQTIGDVDPTALKALTTAGKRQSLPD